MAGHIRTSKAGIVILLSIPLLISGLHADLKWSFLRPSPTGYSLNDLAVLNADTLVAVGAAGTILRTTDGGVTWSSVASRTDAWLTAVWFVDNHTGWAVGHEGIILKTDNSGATWAAQTSGTAASLTDVHFTSAQNGWAVGARIYPYRATILSTTDGGATWVLGPTNIDNAYLDANDVWFTDSLRGWIVGSDYDNSPLIYQTADGGASWTNRSSISSSSYAMYHVYFFDADTGWISGRFDELHRTTDAGVTWNRQTMGTSSTIASMHFTDSQNGRAVARPGTSPSGATIMTTSDGGANWAVQTNATPNDLYLTAVYNIDALTGFAVGTLGYVVKTSDDWATFTELSDRIIYTLSATDFVNPDTGWVVGGDGDDAGHIYKTTDGGTNWAWHSSVAYSHLNDVFFVNDTIGYAVGGRFVNPSKITITKTTDGGSTWTTQMSGGGPALYSVYFIDPDTGWAVGASRVSDGYTGAYYRTTDGGTTWSQLTISNRLFKSVHFTDSQNGMAIGNSYNPFYGYLHTTTDGGATWSAGTFLSSQKIEVMVFTDSQHGWIGGINSTLLQTTNGGANWNTVSIPAEYGYEHFYGAHYMDNDNVWFSTGSGVLRTTDAGATWERDWLAANLGYRNYYDVLIRENGMGLLVGSNGYILESQMLLNPTVASAITDQAQIEDGGTFIAADLDTVFSDGDTPSLYYSITADGGLPATLTGSLLEITPVADYFGVSELIVTATDDQPRSVSDTFRVTITPDNDAPILTGLPDIEYDEDDSVQVDLDDYVTDVDNLSSEITFTAEVTQAQAAPSPVMVRYFTDLQGRYIVDVDAGDLTVAIDPITHVATFTTTRDSSGQFTVVITATDDSLAADTDTMVVTVLATNDGPELAANNGLTVDEGGSAILTSAFLHVTDVDNSPSELGYTLLLHADSLTGMWNLNEVALGDSGTFTQADIDSGRITFDHDGSENVLDSVMFNVTDGVEVLHIPYFPIYISPVNDPPVVAVNAGLSLLESERVNLLPEHLAVSDAESTPYELVYTVTLPPHPLSGELRHYNTPLVTGSTFTQGDINDEAIWFQHDGSEVYLDSIGFSVSDGTDSVAIPYFEFRITPVNDPPSSIQVTGPYYNETINIGVGNINDSLTIFWTESTDPEGQTLYYGLKVTGTLQTAFWDTTVQDTSIQFKYSDIAQRILEGGGLTVIWGDWNVFVTDIEDTTWAFGSAYPLTFSVDDLGTLGGLLIPTEFALHQNYPNPFNPSTTVRFDLPQAAEVHLIVYDLLGREVVRLVHETLQPAYHQITWNGRTADGKEVPTGIYIARLVTPQYTKSIKMLLLK